MSHADESPGRNAIGDNGSDTSGFVSYSNSISSSKASTKNLSQNGYQCSLSTTNSTSPSNTSSVLKESQIFSPSNNRRTSSGQKLAAKLFHALTPCRGRVPRRSHSLCVVSKEKENFITRQSDAELSARSLYGWNRDPVNGCFQYTPSPTVIDVLASRNYRASALNIPSSSSFLAGSSSCAQQLDTNLTGVTPELLEFRRRWPTAFITLVTNYLGFLTFSPEDIESIREALIKEAKHTPRLCGSSVETSELTNAPLRSYRSRDSKPRDKDLDHWYVVVSTIMEHLLQNERFKQRFILRRPANHSTVNEVEKILFPPRHRALSVASARNRRAFGGSTNGSGDCPTALQSFYHKHHHCRPATAAEVMDIIQSYDAPVIACLLSRVLRRQGCGLIPGYLRRLFLQLVSGVNENDLYRRRAIRLLFRLAPTQLLERVVQPLFTLLARVADEPECEVDETSLAVLFAPILFLDKHTTTPASLANPLPAKVVLLLVKWARSELHCPEKSVARLFLLPSLFVKDCAKNLRAHLTGDNPPLVCSLTYCVTMTPSPLSQGKVTERESQEQPSKCDIPIINLTATFLAKRPRQLSPFENKHGNTTPVLKNALHAPMLDFRVRRTPVQGSRPQCLSTRSQTSSMTHSSNELSLR